MAFDWTSDAPGWIDAGGVRLEAQAWGPPPGAAPTLLLLHEGLGCLVLWRDFPQRLAEATGFGVFAWSRAGYGRSGAADLPRPLDYMTREAVEVLPQVLEAIGFQRGVLMGHSDGATIAAIYAGSVEDFRVRGIVLLAPHFFTEPGGLASIAVARQAFETGDLNARMAKYHDNPGATFRGWNEAWLDLGFKDWNVADAIDYWRIPALVIQGQDDQYGTLAQVEEAEARSYAPVDAVVLEQCGHAPQHDQPAATLAAVADFCARLERIEHAQVEVG